MDAVQQIRNAAHQQGCLYTETVQNRIAMTQKTMPTDTVCFKSTLTDYTGPNIK